MESIVSSKDRLHFFEYMEIDVLQEYFRTGIHYFVNAILNGYPQLIRFRYWSLEIATSIDFIKDLLYLITKNVTYAENFFDFDRKVAAGSKILALKSAVVWTIIPYLLTKIDGYYNQLVGEEIDGQRHGLIKKGFKMLYPLIYAVVGILQVLYKFRYLYSMSEKEKYYNLLYQLNGVQLGHRQMAEEVKYPFLELMKKPGILIILMGHKLLTWYFSHKNAKQQATVAEERVEVAAPVEEEKVDEEGKCPICTKNIKNATMVRNSGYVYCFDCIN
jgi:hypothetical protein